MFGLEKGAGVRTTPPAPGTAFAARTPVEDIAHALPDGYHPITSPEALRAVRSVEVLERCGTPAARQLLETLAGGAPAARMTREAKSALQRLAARPSQAVLP